MKALCGLWNLPSPERSGCGGPRTLQTGPVPLLGFRANSCLGPLVVDRAELPQRKT